MNKFEDLIMAKLSCLQPGIKEGLLSLKRNRKIGEG